MWSKIRLAIQGTTALAGIIWLFYFINQFINLVRNGKMKDIFEWIEKKYLSNKKQLEKTDKKSLMN